MPSAPEVVTKAEFARRLGFSRANVSQLVRKGLPVRKDGLLEFAKAEKWYQKSLVRKSRRKPRAEPAPAAVDEDPPAEPEAAANGHGAPVNGTNGHAAAVDDGGQSYAIARAKREGWNAEKARIEVAARRGELIDRGDVEKALFEVARQTRDAVLSVPDRLAAILVSAEDESKAHQLLRDELEQALAALSGGLARGQPR